MLLMLSVAPLLAQKPVPALHPGKWQIDSVTTAADGRTVSSTTNVCAKEQMDFWKVAQPGLSCKPPKTHPRPDGSLHVVVVCIYDMDSLHSDIRSDVVETITAGGERFSATGTQTTNTVYQGVRPTVNTIHLQATAHRLGPC
jgi:hypothetical protein